MKFLHKFKKLTFNTLCTLIILVACSQQSQSHYEIPQETDDGWETASLSDAQVDPRKIDDLMSAIRDKKLKNVHSVIIVKI